MDFGVGWAKNHILEFIQLIRWKVGPTSKLKNYHLFIIKVTNEYG